MNFIIWLIIGGVIGWLASIVMRTDGQQGIVLNIVVGIVGSYIGGFLFGPMLGSAGQIGPYLSAFLGAIVLLAIVNLVRRGSVR
ncbi:GlsB/YeaQ/YmgE family stress response membrane protein [Sphingomonas sp. SUN039]|uniref:GlsB/YeaQ/YmgE family stress response membrane protein n=1 Tax=Sphingomonas sp. SUN039 TaxID=2937787 RepID=UPI002164E090|nr:GlsB/YeaQ/YmgE family stress response membrane protein [Sphingomonas sp. SUN039]UVO55611.1 GlsB/YeaQ/YmgE family stress response membrane protein [Sphingomonas sp. SUN039]